MGGGLYSGDANFSKNGSVYVNLQDEFGNPLKDVGVNASDLYGEVYTDKNGNALLTDLSTYERTIIKAE